MDVTPFVEVRPAPAAVFERAAATPNAPRFMVQGGAGWEPVSWGALSEGVRDVAAFLADAGVRPGQRVAIVASNSTDWAAASLGILAAGAVMVPVYPASTPDQLRHIVGHSGAEVAFIDRELVSRLALVWGDLPALERAVVFDGDDVGALAAELELPGKTGAKLATWTGARRAGADARARAPCLVDERFAAIELDHTAVMLYTSGTSGAPKGVPLTHRNVGANARDWLLSNAPVLDERAVDLLWLPMSHIFGFGELCLGNTLGFTSYLATPADVLDRLPEVRPSVLMSVPAYWEKIARGALAESTPAGRCARLAEATGGRLRFCLSGGAGLGREVKELFYACGVLIIEGYGLTETSPTLTLNRPGEFRFDSVGKPLPSVDLQLAEDGEILARGPNVFAGYHRDPEATRAAFTDDGWFRTGDIGRFTSDGFLQITGRKKDILVTAGGKNVAPANIEDRFAGDPVIEHVVVYGDGKRYLVAAVWVNRAAAAAELGADDPADGDLRALVSRRIEAANRELARFETIKRFAIIHEPLSVESGLVTASYKVKRKQVHDRFRDVLEGLYAEAASGQPAGTAEVSR